MKANSEKKLGFQRANTLSLNKVMEDMNRIKYRLHCTTAGQLMIRQSLNRCLYLYCSRETEFSQTGAKCAAPMPNRN